MKTFALGFAALVAVTALSAAPALADMNVTGTYAIDINCKGYDEAGKFGGKVEGLNLQITQTLTDLNILIGTVPTNGRVMINADKPDAQAAAAFASCTINSDLDYTGLNYNYLGEIQFSAKDGAIKVKGGYYSGAAIGDQFVSYCKFKGIRNIALDPGVAACAP